MSGGLIQEPSAMAPAWSHEHAGAALREGWDIFECEGSANGPWQVQHLDDASDVPGAPQLESDGDAWRVLLTGNQPHHAAALDFIKAHCPEEYERLMEFAEREEINRAYVPGFSRRPG